MVKIAAHLVDHVFPRLLLFQWVLSVFKRLRYHLQHDLLIEVDVWSRHAISIISKPQSVCDGIRSGPPGHRPQTLCSNHEDPAQRTVWRGFCFGLVIG